MAAFTALRWLINDFFWTDMVFSPFEILFLPDRGRCRLCPVWFDTSNAYAKPARATSELRLNQFNEMRTGSAVENLPLRCIAVERFKINPSWVNN